MQRFRNAAKAATVDFNVKIFEQFSETEKLLAAVPGQLADKPACTALYESLVDFWSKSSGTLRAAVKEACAKHIDKTKEDLDQQYKKLEQNAHGGKHGKPWHYKYSDLAPGANIITHFGETLDKFNLSLLDSQIESFATAVLVHSCLPPGPWACKFVFPVAVKACGGHANIAVGSSSSDEPFNMHSFEEGIL
jgi:hypothetical protein